MATGNGKTPRVVAFTVQGQPMPKPRMTRQDTWKQRPCVQRYRCYSDGMRAQMMSKPRVIFQKARLHVNFWIKGEPRMDIDNLLKSVVEALHPWLIPDDCVKHLPEITAKAMIGCDAPATSIRLEEICDV